MEGEPDVERPALRRLLRNIADTVDDEISCAECFDLVSQYVDLEVAETVSEQTLPRLKQHLQQCGVCREEYEILRDLVRLEAQGRAPSADNLPSSF
jgi:predicted anti-sigma-YlaC factor YlaD